MRSIVHRQAPVHGVPERHFGPYHFLDVLTLQRMWNELKNTGMYKVNASVSWNIHQVRKYLVAVHGE